MHNSTRQWIQTMMSQEVSVGVRRPPRVAKALMPAPEASEPISGWYASSFDLLQGLEVTELAPDEGSSV